MINTIAPLPPVPTVPEDTEFAKQTQAIRDDWGKRVKLNGWKPHHKAYTSYQLEFLLGASSAAGIVGNIKLATYCSGRAFLASVGRDAFKP